MNESPFLFNSSNTKGACLKSQVAPLNTSVVNYFLHILSFILDTLHSYNIHSYVLGAINMIILPAVAELPHLHPCHGIQSLLMTVRTGYSQVFSMYI